jgi:hypothetical protein
MTESPTNSGSSSQGFSGQKGFANPEGMSSYLSESAWRMAPLQPLDAKGRHCGNRKYGRSREVGLFLRGVLALALVLVFGSFRKPNTVYHKEEET